MYHFVAEASVQSAQYPNCQYLKPFQLEAVKFLQFHHDQHTFCVLNDESGLGKTATVSIFLSNATKRCLVIVQNDEERITNWKFHLSLLTNLPIFVISDIANTNQISYQPCVCLIKWSTLRSLDNNLNSCNFDEVIIDNRGEMLNNAFCCATLVKHFERKVNVVISNIDITANVKLLHTILRLGGRLEHHHLNYKIFEKKFNLPDMKSMTHRTFDLEEYFAKREMISFYCRDFRLRRYRQQFEQMLPLVDPGCYKNNLKLWSNEGQMNAHCSFVGEAHQCIIFETETEELMQNFYKEQLAVNKTIAMHSVTQRDAGTVDDDERMSPLVFISDSETDHQVNEIMPPVEVIDLTIETERASLLEFSEPGKTQPTKSYVIDTQLETTEENTEISIETTVKTVDILNSNSNNDKEAEQISKSNSNITKSARKKLLKVRLRRCSQPTVINNKLPINISKSDVKKCKIYKKHTDCTSKHRNVVNDTRETRSMMRCTRSSSNLRNKYMQAELVLNDSIKRIKHKSKSKKTNESTKTPKTTKNSEKSNSSQIMEHDQNTNRTKHDTQLVQQNEKLIIPQPNQNISQISVITASDYRDIECAQRLSYESNLPITERVFRRSWDEFAVPVLSENYLLNAHGQLLTPDNVNNDVITISSSLSSALSSQSRRTEALKSKHSIDNSIMKPPSLEWLVSTKRSSANTNTNVSRCLNKSPDLFSNCSDLELLCVQDRNVFNAFGICGIEAKTMQQQSAQRLCSAKRRDVDKLTYPKSCLDILEKMFEIRQSQDLAATTIQTTTSLLPPHPTIAIGTLSQTSSKTRNESHQITSPNRCNKITNYISVTPQTTTTAKDNNNIEIEPRYDTTPKKRRLSTAMRTPTRKSLKSPKLPKDTAGITKLTRWLPRVEQRTNDSKTTIKRRRLEMV